MIDMQITKENNSNNIFDPQLIHRAIKFNKSNRFNLIIPTQSESFLTTEYHNFIFQPLAQRQRADNIMLKIFGKKNLEIYTINLQAISGINDKEIQIHLDDEPLEFAGDFSKYYFTESTILDYTPENKIDSNPPYFTPNEMQVLINPDTFKITPDLFNEGTDLKSIDDKQFSQFWQIVLKKTLLNKAHGAKSWKEVNEERLRRANKLIQNKDMIPKEIYTEGMLLMGENPSLDNIDPIRNYNRQMAYNSIEESITEGKKVDNQLPIRFDKHGNLIIDKHLSSDLIKEYQHAHTLLYLYKKSESIEPMKNELCRDWSINIILMEGIDKSKNDTDKDKIAEVAKMMSLRSKVLADFKYFLVFVLKRDPEFDFGEYFKNSDYNKQIIKINKETIDSSIDILKHIYS